MHVSLLSTLVIGSTDKETYDKREREKQKENKESNET